MTAVTCGKRGHRLETAGGMSSESVTFGIGGENWMMIRQCIACSEVEVDGVDDNL